MARDFDGTADKLVPASFIDDALTTYSVSVWVKPDNTTGNKGLVVQRSSSSTTPILFQLDVNATDVRLLTRDNAGTALVNATKAGVLTSGSWQNIVGTRSGSDLAVYHNAGAAGTASGTIGATTSGYFTVGAIRTFNLFEGNWFDGGIAEVGIWGVTLTADEVAVLAAGYSPLSVRPASLIFYAPLHGRNGAAGNEEEWTAGNTLTQTSSPGVIDHPRIIYPRRRSWVPKAAASSFKAAWARNSNSVLGAGAPR